VVDGVVVEAAVVADAVTVVDGVVVVGWARVVVRGTVVVDGSVVVRGVFVEGAAPVIVEVVVDGVGAASGASPQAPARMAMVSRPDADRFKIAAGAYAGPGVPGTRRWPSQPAGRCRGPAGRRPGPPGSWRCGMDRSHSRPR